MQVIFYEKVGCAGNKKQKELLKKSGYRVIERDLLSTNWKKESLRAFMGSVKKSFNEFAPDIKNRKIDIELLSENEALELMIKNPILIKRPLVVFDGKKFCGFDAVSEYLKLEKNTLSTCQAKIGSCSQDFLKAWLSAKKFDEDNLNLKYKNGDTPLIIASREGNSEVVKELIKLGADVNILNNDSNGAIWASCFANSLEVLSLLINANADMNNQNINGATALIYASSSKKERVVELLLKSGANRDLETLDGFKALELATTKKIMNMLRS